MGVMGYKVSTGGELQLPLGYKFDPTDRDILCQYLKKKINGEEIMVIIPTADVYSRSPALICTHQVRYGLSNQWFFYTTAAATGDNGVVKARNGCYYEVIGERDVYEDNLIWVGVVRRLEYHWANGTKTDWVVDEFSLPDYGETAAVNDDKKKVVMCRIRFMQPIEI
ncbi:hypothetical protein Tsubulata_004085 [Turnera subulata]|uniref:NAC domain-containing protein n=1 Tax=Turnera subulata TaxID=218843 RepID=A0A9Q0F7U5_9ROSI|nr:hypothetical protein Tsubulata_004085 [Turnera subulata]